MFRTEATQMRPSGRQTESVRVPALSRTLGAPRRQHAIRESTHSHRLRHQPPEPLEPSAHECPAHTLSSRVTFCGRSNTSERAETGTDEEPPLGSAPE